MSYTEEGAPVAVSTVPWPVGAGARHTEINIGAICSRAQLSNYRTRGK